jgi:diphthamide biosynthesis enzyme Dph1/Dph2-like protein
VALQLGDNELGHARRLAAALSQRCPSALVFVLADTSVSACCVDFVAAQHLDASAIVHYGPACLTKCPKYAPNSPPPPCRTDSVPVRYVFLQRALEIPALMAAIARRVATGDFALLLHSHFDHLKTKIEASVRAQYPHAEVAAPSLRDLGADGLNFLSPIYLLDLRVGSYSLKNKSPSLLIYVGEDDTPLARMALEAAHLPVPPSPPVED